MDKDYTSAFTSRKSGGGSSYNYDIEPLIANFTFYDFVTAAEQSKEELTDHGAFLIITNNQYVIGYNAGFGAGAHAPAFARAILALNGKKNQNISGPTEAALLGGSMDSQYIKARILYECCGPNENGRLTYAGLINFNLIPLGSKITPNQFETFKDFYNDYNKDIEYISKKYNFPVRFCYRDENGQMQESITKNLDALYKYLEQNIDHNKVIDEETTIIGTERRNRKK